MSLSLRRLALALSLALPMTLAGAAMAAEPPAAPPHAMRMDPGAEAREHADRLAEILQLRPDQRPALDALMAAMQPPEGMHEPMGDDMARLSTPERLDRMLAHVDAMRAHLAQAAEAAKRFYAQLTPPQQKAFDDLMPMLFGHHEGMGGRMHMHHGGPDEDDMGPGGPEGPGGPPRG